MGALAEAFSLIIVGLIGCILIVGLIVLMESVFARYVRPYQVDGHSPEYARERLAVLQRDRYTCQICGAHPVYVTHHIQPHAQGGPDTRENLITVCEDCHKEIEPK